jgi:hypothetical protein
MGQLVSILIPCYNAKHEQPCCQEHELYLRLLVGDRRFAHHHPKNGAIYRQWSNETVQPGYCGGDVLSGFLDPRPIGTFGIDIRS